ncbi:hypothetical protein [Frankia sp. Cppng1_Ct_nod]|uniref:hypothetical protein n=1 Tax=Frankia sp. Cppng1_Ct_nod TaxID=2897162 RepID=UPI001041A9B3|nr:hypothetical protein [Frankia sp. Cppng1_Ct_nod]
MATINEPSPVAGRVLVHMVGAADLGVPSGPRFREKLAELGAADPAQAARLLTASADPKRPVPLAAVFADGAPRYDRVVLVVTRPQAGTVPDEDFTRPLGTAMKERLESEGLYGVHFEKDAVELLEVGAPHSSKVRAAIRDRLMGMYAGRAAPQVDIQFTSGATNAGIGLVAGTLEAGVEPRLVLLTGGTGRRIPLRDEFPADKENAQRWLIRNRFYSPMIKSDPDNEKLWQSRLDRQILVAETTDRDGDGGTAMGMPEGDLARVLLERIDRYEAVDGFLFRAWLKTRTRGLADRDNTDLDAKLDDLIRRRFPDRETRSRQETLARREIESLRDVRRAKGLRTSALDFLLHPRLPAAENAAKDLAHGNRADPKDPRIIGRFLEAQSYLPRHDEEIVKIGYPRWPYLGDQRALILIALGKGRGEDSLTSGLDGLIRQARQDDRYDITPMIRIVVSAETEPIGRLWEAKARAQDVDCRVLLTCGIDFGDLEAIRCDVWDALAADDGELDTVGEVWVVTGPGPKPQGLGLLLTGIEWGLSSACPTRLVEIRSAAAGSNESIVELDREAILNRVAGEAELAGVALSALDCLDISAAAAALDQGWAGSLRPLAARVRRLSLVPAPRDGVRGRKRPTAGTGAGIDPEWLASIGMPDQETSSLLLLRPRLRLVQTLAKSDPWGCAVRAAALCEGTLGKDGDTGWRTLCDRKSPRHVRQANDLACYRNASPAAHKEEVDRRRSAAGRPISRRPSAEELRDCLRGLREGLSRHVTVNGRRLPDTGDDVLVDELERLKKELRAFTAAT